MNLWQAVLSSDFLTSTKVQSHSQVCELCTVASSILSQIFPLGVGGDQNRDKWRPDIELKFVWCAPNNHLV